MGLVVCFRVKNDSPLNTHVAVLWVNQEVTYMRADEVSLDESSISGLSGIHPGTYPCKGRMKADYY
jgi:hypothetical protein